ncbi:MAG: peptidyl-prolyl cis-trans isomerase [Deltaproteobacteria bacterium]|nr:peptidyl-prolyl cis-trans isomerase [Candidatus Deferrimicrobiaceae bacterium]
MRRISIRLSGLLCAAALAALFLSCSREHPPPADAEIAVAEVNGSRISLLDLKNEIAARRGLTPSLAARSAGRREIQEALRGLIDRAVVLEEGKRLGVSVAGSEVEKEVERYRSDFPPGGLEKALLQAGMDMEAWRGELARSLLYRKAAGAIAASRAAVTDEEVEAAFLGRERQLPRPERIRVRQFLFPSEESAVDARGRIENGETPDDVLHRYSAGDVRPTVAELGDVSREDLPADIAAELFPMKEGGVSGVVVREQSYSFFQVERKEPAGKPSLADAAPQIREELLRARREEAFRAWLTSQEGRAKIKVEEALLERLAEGGK